MSPECSSGAIGVVLDFPSASSIWVNENGLNVQSSTTITYKPNLSNLLLEYYTHLKVSVAGTAVEKFFFWFRWRQQNRPYLPRNKTKQTICQPSFLRDIFV